MAHTLSQSNKIQLILSSTILGLGLILLIFMITVEDEPGALPLALILIGSVWHWILRKRRNKPVP